MARNWFKSGEWNVYCMVCNRKIKSGLALKRWDGLIVCPDDYENRHPMDFLRAQQERISVPFTSDTSFDQFDGPDYPPYTACTQQGSSAVPSWAVAGCMRPGLGFPGNYQPTIPTDPDEPTTIPIGLLSGANLLLMSGAMLNKVNLDD